MLFAVVVMNRPAPLLLCTSKLQRDKRERCGGSRCPDRFGPKFRDKAARVTEPVGGRREEGTDGPGNHQRRSVI